MRILDFSGNEVEANEDLGYTREETIIIAHHDAISAVEQKWHYEVEKEYPNGGKIVRRVVDVPGVEAQDAWDETEDILRFVSYTEEELAERAEQERLRLEAERQAEEDERLAREEAERALEEKERENAHLKAQVAALVENQQFLEDCIAEMAEIVYA